MNCPHCGLTIFGHGILPLSRKEKRIARLIRDEGLPNKDIAERLGVHEQTVKMYLGSIFEKLRVRNRLELFIVLSAPLDSPFRLNIENREWNPHLRT